ncbi:TIR domain-containing protein [Sorangium sp. So ce542]|uniref:TIR domain-containing protein n=1 Tax=Sorangium sp. So ce542 TaxID=3133316 RepID=UPI003F60F5D0
MSSRTPSVFLSYSHKDAKWKERLVVHLRVSEHEGLCDVWDDTRIGAGNDRRQELREALEGAAVAVLLVSANLLTSEIAHSEEIPRLLQRRAAEGVRIFPIIVEPCDYEAVDWLRRMEVRPKNGKAISTRKKPQAETELLEIVKEIRALLQSFATKPAPIQNQDRAKKKVLWVDDYPTNNENLIKSYRKRGLYFDLVIDNDQAIERLQNSTYDLLITDMKHESDKEAGLRLLRWLKRLPSPPPAIVFSGVGPGDYRYDAALEEGAALVTIDPRALGLKIEELLHLR